MTTTTTNGTSTGGSTVNGGSMESTANGTIQASRIPRSSSSTLHEKKSAAQLRNDETISPVTRKRDGLLSTRARRPLSRSLLPFPPPPTSTAPPPSRRQETYLILHPKDDKSERRVILIPPPTAVPVRVGRVVNPKTPAKFDNMLFDTKVLSRNHAECFSDGNGRVFIRDSGSSNGTYINGFRLSTDGVPSEPFQLIVGQELALGIDIREETNQDNIAYHRVWFTVEHVGPMTPPPPETPTPSTLGAVDLDPWIPKPSTRDIVDHLVQEINAAKQIAEEITCVQQVLDGMMQEDGGESVERVQRELEEKTRRVEELEGLLGVEREERRQLEERIREMEDERALKMVVIPMEEDKDEEEEGEGESERARTETTLVNESSSQGSPISSLAIPVIVEEPSTSQEPSASTVTEEPATPPLSPSTAPSSPTQETSSTRSISPISLPSTESSHPDTSHLLEKITSLEQQLLQAQQQIAEYKNQLSASPIIGAAMHSLSTSQGQGSSVLAALTTSTDFAFTFSAPTMTPSTPRRRPTGSLRSSRRRTSTNQPPSNTDSHSESEMVVSGKSGGSGAKKSPMDNKEFVDGLCAAVGVVVLGWMGMWFINHLVDRGDRVVR